MFVVGKERQRTQSNAIVQHRLYVALAIFKNQFLSHILFSTLNKEGDKPRLLQMLPKKYSSSVDLK